jgi:hypothetical protein
MPLKKVCHSGPSPSPPAPASLRYCPHVRGLTPYAPMWSGVGGPSVASLSLSGITMRSAGPFGCRGGSTTPVTPCRRGMGHPGLWSAEQRQRPSVCDRQPASPDTVRERTAEPCVKRGNWLHRCRPFVPHDPVQRCSVVSLPFPYPPPSPSPSRPLPSPLHLPPQGTRSPWQRSCWSRPRGPPPSPRRCWTWLAAGSAWPPCWQRGASWIR